MRMPPSFPHVFDHFWNARCSSEIPPRLGREFSSPQGGIPAVEQTSGAMPLMFMWVPLLRRRCKASARYGALFRDDAVESAFAILVKLSHACGSHNLHEALSASGIPASEPAPLPPIVNAPRKIPVDEPAMVYGQITIAAAAHAAGNWYKRNAGQQMPIFIRGGHPETGRASATRRKLCEGHP